MGLSIFKLNKDIIKVHLLLKLAKQKHKKTSKNEATVIIINILRLNYKELCYFHFFNS